MKLAQNIPVYYHSGTGNTEYVLRNYEKEFNQHGITISLKKITYNQSPGEVELSGGFGIAAPIYGFGTSSNVKHFVKNLPQGQGQPVFIVRTAAGGEVPRNANASAYLIKTLRKKGYSVFYNRIIIMPSNWMMAHPDAYILDLIKILPEKVRHSVQEILNGKERMQSMNFFKAFLFNIIEKFETVGAKKFGQKLFADNNCNLCQQCEKKCPVNNIEIKDDKVYFKNKCIWCMKCIYDCPQQAIKAGRSKSAVLKEPYNIKNVLLKDEDKVTVDERTEMFRNRFSWYLNDAAK